MARQALLNINALSLCLPRIGERLHVAHLRSTYTAASRAVRLRCRCTKPHDISLATRAANHTPRWRRHRAHLPRVEQRCRAAYHRGSARNGNERSSLSVCAV